MVPFLVLYLDTPQKEHQPYPFKIISDFVTYLVRCLGAKCWLALNSSPVFQLWLMNGSNVIGYKLRWE